MLIGPFDAFFPNATNIPLKVVATSPRPSIVSTTTSTMNLVSAAQSSGPLRHITSPPSTTGIHGRGGISQLNPVPSNTGTNSPSSNAIKRVANNTLPYPPSFVNSKTTHLQPPPVLNEKKEATGYKYRYYVSPKLHTAVRRQPQNKAAQNVVGNYYICIFTLHVRLRAPNIRMRDCHSSSPSPTTKASHSQMHQRYYCYPLSSMSN